MGKSKNTSKSEVEYLRGENKRLRKQLKQLTRTSHIPNTIVEAMEPKEDLLDSRPTCSDCGKGKVETIDLGIRIIQKCLVCENQKILKK